ncbi:peptidase domain-containing ABC transporter [Mesorhizobium sp. NPDC059025]|uniref:peptidase domain-containing ABC transporter n=1 Tax=unclassified Mesorhizobium TaxID=325217 RepID=UPI003670104C
MTVLERLAFGFRPCLPVILQTEAAECGLASLAMIASHHGHQIDISSMRLRFSASLKGMTLHNIADLANKLLLSTRAVQVALDDLRNLKTPCVLHWDFSHFVVLDKVTAKGAIIHDPARGRRHVSRRELDQSFTGVALEVWPASSFSPKVEQNRFQLISLFRGVVGLKRALAQIFLLALCLEVFAILSPLGLQLIIDQAIVGADFDLVTVVTIGLALLVILQTTIGFVRSWGTMVLMTRLAVQWDIGLFSHLMRLPLSWFEKRHVGDIVSRFGSIQTIQHTLTTDLVSSIMDSLMVVGMLAMMFLYSPPLAAISLIITGLYVLVRILFYRPYRSATEAELVYHARENTHFMESVRGASSVKALGLEERRQSTWLNALVDAVNAGLKTNKLDMVFNGVNGLLFGFGRVLMLWLGSRAVIHGNLTVGMLMAVSSYQEQFTSRVTELINMICKLRMLSLQGERLADIALAAPEISKSSGRGGNSTGSVAGHLEARGLRFRYGDGEPDVLRDISLTIEAGESIAIVGPSGCGKSTLLKILAGLMHPTEGRVCLDGSDIRDMGHSNYRKITGCVLQDDQLFAGTLSENISAFDPHADSAWIEECARLAAIDDEIRMMPMGYESLVGDMGSALSGGQKQRLFLARALQRKPRILLLDEATSHLDEDNENRINRALADLRITRVIVAHRPSTIAMVDRVIVIGDRRASNP